MFRDTIHNTLCKVVNSSASDHFMHSLQKDTNNAKFILNRYLNLSVFSEAFTTKYNVSLDEFLQHVHVGLTQNKIELVPLERKGRWAGGTPDLTEVECQWPGCDSAPEQRDHCIPHMYAIDPLTEGMICAPDRNLFQVCRFHNFVKNDSLLLGIILCCV